LFLRSGGAQVLADTLVKKVKNKPYFYRRVVGIKETTVGNVHPLSVTIDCRDDPNLMKNGLLERKYSNIICTLPLSCVRLIDLDGCPLLAGQRNALRELQYSPSIKIGIQFKSAWWEKEPVSIIGGQSYTDRPVRTVVYPSNKPGDGNHPNVSVLIASYNGMQDSQRLGALMRGRDTPEERILLNLVMKDLAIIHGVEVDMLWAQYVDYYPWDWYSSSFSMGMVYPHLEADMVLPISFF
jgi:monoamine oxidase